MIGSGALCRPIECKIQRSYLLLVFRALYNSPSPTVSVNPCSCPVLHLSAFQHRTNHLPFNPSHCWTLIASNYISLNPRPGQELSQVLACEAMAGIFVDISSLDPPFVLSAYNVLLQGSCSSTSP